MNEIALVDVVTGEFLKVGERSLDEIAESCRHNLDASEDLRLLAGRDLAQARKLCKSPDCGIEGDNPDARFGAWVSVNFTDTSIDTLYKLRRRFEVFGDRQEEMAEIGIGVSSQYLLSSEQYSDCMETIIDELKKHKEQNALDRVKGKDVEEIAKRVSGGVLATLHTGDEESYTPTQYLESARKVLGGFDLDPASNPMAQENVRAGTYYTVDDDGLSKPWAGTVWMNPPYTARVINLFIAKLVNHFLDGDVTAAIILTNNNTDTSWFHEGMSAASACCFTAGRINFLKRDGSTSSPTNGQAFFYFGEDVNSFTAEFSKHGLVMVPA